MGWSETDQGCKRHPAPGLNKLPGVCSSCLRERLTRLSSYSSNDKISMSAYSFYSTSPPYSSASSSTFISPANRRRHRRNASEMLGSISLRFNFSTGLKKSRSISFVANNQFAEVKDENKKKKKSGLWSKLLRVTGRF